MKKTFVLLLVNVMVVCYSLSAQNKDYTAYVNPFIGTGGHGHTYPGATMPFGMVQLSPDTRLSGWDGCSGYHYSDTLIYGFSHTHLNGTGCSDYGDILLMPTSGNVDLKGYAYASKFSHKNEKASPGYYAVKLDKDNIKAELTVSKRAGFHRYTYSGGTQNNVILDLQHRDVVLDSYVEFVSNTHIRGMRRSAAWATNQVVYFDIQFSKPFSKYGLCEMDTEGNILKTAKNNASGKHVKAWFNFGSEQEVLVKVGISANNVEFANLNLEDGIKGWDFDAVRKQAVAEWNRELGKIEVSGGSKDQLATFYTALYHCMINPNLYSDANGAYLGRDLKTHYTQGYDYYTVFSLWDTFRAEHPLLSLIDTKRTNDFVNTFIQQYQQGGLLPVWELSANETNCMIAYHAISVMADAYAKGIRKYDVAEALKAMKASAADSNFGLAAYKKFGYIPGDKEGESVSRTLEYAYDDWCIALLCKASGDEAGYKEFITRAQFWKNIFDPQTGFMRPKFNGAWQTPFDPAEVTFNYTEANAWQYSFFVPQDISGLAAAYGGKANLIKKLDELFSTSQSLKGREQADITGMVGQYAHGNEPSHHMAYLYNYLNQPYKTQELVNKILTTLYSNQPDGLCGNEDCGQMSAWYVLSALGIYQVCPGNPQFAIGSPLFAEAKIHLENGKTFTIKAKNRSARNYYILDAHLNDTLYNKCYLNYNTIMKGGTLECSMGDKPNTAWGADDSDVPVTYIQDEALVTSPFTTASGKTFNDSIVVELKTNTAGATILYSVDGWGEGKPIHKYTSPLVFRKTTHLTAVSMVNDYVLSHMMEADYYKSNLNRKITLLSPYSSQYTGGGNNALIDQLRGGKNFRLGEWQGYDSVDFEAIVDLGSVQRVHRMGLGCLQDIGSWIWMPSQVEFYGSDDGVNFKLLALLPNTIPENDYNATIHDFDYLTDLDVRYIKVKARNHGPIPSWHPGAGYPSWIFVDEIVVE
ncbi:MAG: GH92 family glycosyl hydrolase [Bacteroidota bacterium]